MGEQTVGGVTLMMDSWMCSNRSHSHHSSSGAMMQPLSPTTRCPAVQLRHSDTKGRCLVAASDIEAGQMLWQEQPIITCASVVGTISVAAAAATGDPTAAAASPEERVWSRLHASLSAHVSPSDLLLTLHALRRLRLFGRRSRCWDLIQQLQHSGEADSGQPDSASSAAPSPFARRFQRIHSVAQTIDAQLQREIVADAIDSASAAARPMDPSGTVTIDAALITRILGVLQLNAHRCAPLPNHAMNTMAAAGSGESGQSASSGAVVAPPAGAPGKGLSLQLSMLEHDCQPNVHFSSQWIPHSDDQAAALCDEDERLESVGVTEGSITLRASSARSSTHTLVMTLRTLRSVSAGESLSISYYPCRVRTAMRQTHLRNQYGFTCRCERCEGMDDTRTFHCCYPALDAADASERSVGDAASVDHSPKRCPGVMMPRCLGQSPVSFRCALCDRTLQTEDQYRAVCEWEQKMRGANGGVALAAAIDTRDTLQSSDSAGSEVSFSPYPHPSHYLYPHSLTATR